MSYWFTCFLLYSFLGYCLEKLFARAVHSDRLEVEPYLDDELVLLCGRDHPLAAAPSITVEQLHGVRLLL